MVCKPEDLNLNPQPGMTGTVGLKQDCWGLLGRMVRERSQPKPDCPLPDIHKLKDKAYHKAKTDFGVICSRWWLVTTEIGSPARISFPTTAQCC